MNCYQSTFFIPNLFSNVYQAKIVNNFVLIQPNSEKNIHEDIIKKNGQNEATNFIHANSQQNRQQQKIQSQLSQLSQMQQIYHQIQSQLISNKLLQTPYKISQICQISKISPIRHRKNKHEKSSQIISSQKDDGRGGNCIASNISKTLLRITTNILCVDKNNKEKFNQLLKLIRKYKIKSQKENTIILLLILYVMVKEEKIEKIKFDQIFKQFLDSLEESERNCQRKMDKQENRKSFHLKNKKMYAKFIQINTKLFKFLKNKLSSQQSFNFSQHQQKQKQKQQKIIIEQCSSSSTLSPFSSFSFSQPHTICLSTLQSLISDTYDRKQRQIQKSIRKIKSIILNHKQLKELFNYYENSIQQSIDQAIQYAYRRNLQKRCKQVKNNIKNIMGFVERIQNDKKINKINELFFQKQEQLCKYLKVYICLDIIDDKTQQIWQQFVNNMKMKKQFNLQEKQLNQFEVLLKSTVPQMFQDIKKLSNQNNNNKKYININVNVNINVNIEMEQCKIQEEDISIKMDNINNKKICGNNIIQSYSLLYNQIKREFFF